MQQENTNTQEKEEKKEKQEVKHFNPYTNAKAEWLERYGDLIKQRRNWQIIAIICAISSLLALFFLSYMGSQNKFIPYIIEVDKLGNYQRIGALRQSDLKNPNVTKYNLSTFITDWRTIWGNGETQTKYIFEAYNFLEPNSRAFNMVNEYFATNNPFKRAQTEKINVQVKIKSIIKQGESDIWEVQWEESTLNSAGNLMQSENYRGLFHTKQIEPTTAEQIYRNPLGIFITDMNYAKVV